MLPLLKWQGHFKEEQTFAVLANHMAQGSATIDPRGPVGRFLTLPGVGITRYDGSRVPRYIFPDRGGKYLRAFCGRNVQVHVVDFSGTM